MDQIKKTEEEIKEEEERKKREQEENNKYEELKILSNKGDINATVELASLLYYGGEFIKQNPEESFSLFNKASEKGNNKAKYHLGVIYSMG